MYSATSATFKDLKTSWPYIFLQLWWKFIFHHKPFLYERTKVDSLISKVVTGVPLVTALLWFFSLKLLSLVSKVYSSKRNHFLTLTLNLKFNFHLYQPCYRYQEIAIHILNSLKKMYKPFTDLEFTHLY